MTPTSPHQENSLYIAELLRAIPPREQGGSLQGAIRGLLSELNAVIAVLDDDPTGTQTVHGVQVYLNWSERVLIEEMRTGPGLFYLLTNSRAMTEEQAAILNRNTGRQLRSAARACGKRVILVSRSDSTLRGHYPGEVESLLGGFGAPGAAHVLAPFFEEGGRYTCGDVHYVKEGPVLIPAAQTPFAKDPTFGYSHSSLVDWVLEKGKGQVERDAITSIPLEMSRQHDGEAIRKLLKNEDYKVYILNALEDEDLEPAILASLEVMKEGRFLVFRSGASLVRVLAGMAKKPLLDRNEIKNPSGSGGLVIVGSFVPKSTEQFAHLKANVNSESIELDVRAFLDTPNPEEMITELAGRISAGLSADKTVVYYTSRQLIKAADKSESLRINMKISSALVETMKRVAVHPRFLVAKGGITSSEIASKALNMDRAEVIGQILPGVPVWLPAEDSRFPGLKYVVFPGNVGNTESLTQAVEKFL